MRQYETIFIMDPTISEETSEQVVSRMQEVVGANGGDILKVEKWGKKRLAYEVKKHKKGEFVLFWYEGEPVTVSELERNFKMTDPVIKFMTVKLEKEMIKARQAQMEKEAADARDAAAAEKEAPKAEAAPAEGGAEGEGAGAPAEAGDTEGPEEAEG